MMAPRCQATYLVTYGKDQTSGTFQFDTMDQLVARTNALLAVGYEAVFVRFTDPTGVEIGTISLGAPIGFDPTQEGR
jgi:hypothetical protein